MADWLKKGDLGIGEEPDIEMVMNGNGRFHGVNPAYEKVRKDSDGDGLSDQWEKYNKRNPKDGVLQFEFDCGGWQTEGWKSNGDLTNISGRQGFLDFDMLATNASISRSGLKLDSAKNQGKLIIKVRSSHDLKITLNANQKIIGSASATAKKYREIEIPLSKDWTGQINSLKLDFATEKGATIEIDWIRVSK